MGFNILLNNIDCTLKDDKGKIKFKSEDGITCYVLDDNVFYPFLKFCFTKEAKVKVLEAIVKEAKEFGINVNCGRRMIGIDGVYGRELDGLTIYSNKRTDILLFGVYAFNYLLSKEDLEGRPYIDYIYDCVLSKFFDFDFKLLKKRNTLQCNLPSVGPKSNHSLISDRLLMECFYLRGVDAWEFISETMLEFTKNKNKNKSEKDDDFIFINKSIDNFWGLEITFVSSEAVLKEMIVYVINNLYQNV